MKKELTEEEIETTSYNQDLYEAAFRGDNSFYCEIWNEIKENESVLKTAIKVTKNRRNNYTLFGLLIADAILNNCNDVSPNIYNELINIIYTNADIARLSGSGIKKSTFLEKTLCNPDLELTEEQKKFAVKEAMFQSNTKLHSIVPSHSLGFFDIRYLILMNKNWDMEEKAELIYDFYQEDEYYDEVIEHWEWDIVNYYSFTNLAELDKVRLYEYTYQELSNKYKKEDADSIYEEITMCKLFHQMRPQTWEIDGSNVGSKKTVYTKKK